MHLTVLRHYEQSRNISLTCRHFGISRPAFYRWQASYNRVSLHGLEDRSHRPHRVILPTWSTAQAIAVRKVREQYPYMGKRKVQVLLERCQFTAESRLSRRLWEARPGTPDRL